MRFKKTRKTPPLTTTAEIDARDAVQQCVVEWSKSTKNLRLALRDFIYKAREEKAKFDNPKALLTEMGFFEGDEKELTYLRHLVSATYGEYIFDLPVFAVNNTALSILASLPNGTIHKVWDIAKSIKGNNEYPNEIHIQEAKKILKRQNDYLKNPDDYLTVDDLE